MLAMKAPPSGSLEVVPSGDGKHLNHCCGFTENVHSPALHRFLLLINVRSTAGSGKSVLRFVVARLILAMIIDHLPARPSSRISSATPKQDRLTWPSSSSILRIRRRTSVHYFLLLLSSSAINPIFSSTFCFTIIPPTNLARNNPVTIHFHFASRTSSGFPGMCQ